MNCSIIKDLIPLRIDHCCSEESAKIVDEHINTCPKCQKLYEEMNTPTAVATLPEPPVVMRKVKHWQASVIQSALLFLSFALITAGVALEAKTPAGSANGFWAVTMIIPATGFMLSLANWYFVSIYKSRKNFSTCSLLWTVGFTALAYVWAVLHYEMDLIQMFRQMHHPEILHGGRDMHFFDYGLLLTAVLCAVSKVLSNLYAKILGKE